AVKLPHLDAWNQARRDKTARYNALLADAGVTTPVEAAGCRSVYHLYAIEVERRDALLQHLQALGIGAGIHYPIPVHLQPAYADLGYHAGAFPQAEAVAARELSLPLFAEMTDEQQDTIVAAVKQFYA
ncbi:MAG: erythromycin biosynthesis sensory transduction protein eryC1, partial [Chloroflexi bacterium]|nr:erythromycin biosynthesis sensory transduction protein eryC1 [Chloroflexota bacterium]